MLSWKRIGRQRRVQVALGPLGAQYLRLVFKTTRVTIDPPDGYARIDAHLPVIIAMWHGQHFMAGFMRRPGDRGKVLISRHRDAELNAVVAARLGIETIRGSGDNGVEFVRKGGLGAFRQMVDALHDKHSAALAPSRRYVLDNGDKTTINRPFSRGAAVCGEPVWVPPDATDETLEGCRRQIEDNLNAATARAYAIADERDGNAGRG